MLLTDDLKAIFRSCFFEESTRTLRIQESEREARVKTAIFETEGELFHISKDFLDASKEQYLKNCDCQGPELEHCCDGIIISPEKDRNYVFLVELKSKYTKDNVAKALKQLAASYIKLITTFFPFRNFKQEEWIFAGLLVSLPISDEDITSYKKQIEINGTYAPLFRFALNLHTKKEFFVDQEYLKFDKLPLKEELLLKKLPLFYVESSEEPIDLTIYKERLANTF